MISSSCFFLSMQRICLYCLLCDLTKIRPTWINWLKEICANSINFKANFNHSFVDDNNNKKTRTDKIKKTTNDELKFPRRVRLM